MAEVTNTNVFDVNTKFVDFAGLDYFWDKAKAYIDAADKVTADKVTTLEGDVKSIQEELESLSGGAGSIATQINNAIDALDLPNTYEAKGSAATAEQNAKNYADGLADNYDAAGSAATAEQNAKKYTDDEIIEAVGTWTVDETPGTGLRKEIEDKVAAVAADAKSYSIAPVTGDELAGLGTNVKEAYKLVDEDGTTAGDVIKIYKDSALQKVELDKQELVFTYLLATGAEDVVRVDVSKFLAESEFGNGLQVNSESGIVSVKVDAASEGFLTVGADGIKLSGVQGAINTAEQNAKDYADGLASNYDAAGAAATAEQNAKDYADSLASNYDAAGAATTAETNAKAYADSLASNYDAAGAAAAAKAEAIADAEAKLKAVTDTLKSAAFVEVSDLEATMDSKDATNLTAAKTYAATYTDALFDSIQFAENTDIDKIFAPETPEEGTETV